MENSNSVTAPSAPEQLRRTAFVFNGMMNTENAFQNFCKLVAEFLDLNIGNNRPLLLRLNSSGGVPEQINALCGMLREVKRQKHEVHVHVMSQLCNFTYMIAAIADKVSMEPSASLVYGQSRVTISGTPRNMRNDFKYRKELFTKLCTAVANRSKGQLTLDEVLGWKAKHISAQDAFKLGLCDEVFEMPAPIVKPDLPEHVMNPLNDSFTNETNIFNFQIKLHSWLEKPENYGRPLRLFFTSWGGTVVQALSLYGLLCEAQRQGHYLTIQIVGEAYSCALWFSTCALKSGEVLIDQDAMFMFHAPSTSLTGDLDELEAMLVLDDSMFLQTSSLLSLAEGFTQATLDQWVTEPDRYMTATDVVALGLGKLV